MAFDPAIERSPLPPSPWQRAASAVALLGAGAILLIALAVMADVLMRFLFNAPILAVDDLTGIFMAVAIACCLPAGIAGKQLVTIRLFGRAAGDATGPWLDCFGDGVSLIFFIVLAWQFVLFARDASASGLGSPVLQIAQAPWWWAVSFVLVLCVPFQGAVLVASFRRARASR